MAESSSNTIESVETLVEALRYASTLVDNASGQVDVTYEFLSTYDYYGAIDLTVPFGTVIQAPVVDIDNPDASKFYAYTQENMANYFYLKTDSTSSGTNIMSPAEGIANGYQMLTQEMLSLYSLVSNGKISLPTAYYADSVVFDEANDDDDTVIPLSVARSLYYDTATNIPISDSDWDVYIRIGGTVFETPTGKDFINITNSKVTKPIVAGSIALSTAPRAFSELLDPFVGPELILDSDAEIPEDHMGHDFNMITGRALRSMPVYKSGATVSLTMEEMATDAELIQLVEDYFVSSGYFSVYDGVDQMLTHAQAEKLADHIIKKVMSINDSGLQI